MIFYGTNSSTIKKGQLRNISCPNCQNEVTMSYSVFGKYAHIYWIPFFPTGKVNIVECNNCKATYDLKDLDQKVKDKFKVEQERNPAKTPLKHFSAIGVIAILLATFIYYDKQKDDDTMMYAKNPKVGDVYYYEVPDMKNHYSTFKITKITTDSIHILENNMEIDSKTDMDKILMDSNYTYPNSYGTSELKDLSKDLEVFFKITRN